MNEFAEFRRACCAGDVEKVNFFLNAGYSPMYDLGFPLVIASERGHTALSERLMQDPRADPSFNKNEAVRSAARFRSYAIFHRLMDDSRVDTTAVFNATPVYSHRIFECRERFAEICIALQELNLPAWVTVKILKACKPWSTLKLHQKWKLVCAVKHFHDKE